jgi:hypothetical protein
MLHSTLRGRSDLLLDALRHPLEYDRLYDNWSHRVFVRIGMTGCIRGV